MSDDAKAPQPTPNSSVPSSASSPYAGIGASLLLSAIAIWLVLWGFWIVNATYERFRGRTDLDMPDWFDINITLTFKVLPLATLAGILNLLSAAVSITWVGQVGWTIRIGFVLQWAAAMTIVILLFVSLPP